MTKSSLCFGYVPCYEGHHATQEPGLVSEARVVWIKVSPYSESPYASLPRCTELFPERRCNPSNRFLTDERYSKRALLLAKKDLEPYRHLIWSTWKIAQQIVVKTNPPKFTCRRVVLRWN